jgi:lipoprotein-anchoring transpeptidase ErfK/SrfK
MNDRGIDLMPAVNPSAFLPSRISFALASSILALTLTSQPIQATPRTGPSFSPRATNASAQVAGLATAWLEWETSRVLPGMDLRARPPITDAWGIELGKGSFLQAQAFDPKSARDRNSGLLAVPALEGGLARMLDADGELILQFDRPVGNLGVRGPLSASVSAVDASRRSFRLQAAGYAQGQTYPLQVTWQTVTGTPLPPLQMEVATPPALEARLNVQGIDNLGLMLPLQLIFSEPVRDRMTAKLAVSVKTSDGADVPGYWHWVGKQRLQFTPRPAWPASTTFEVRGDDTLLRAESGGRLEAPLTGRFSTGTDRHIFVYLDRQQATAVENGQVVRTFKVSTGKAKTPTATGNFYIYDRYLRKTMRSRGIPKGRPGYYEVEDVPYTQFFKGDLALHGAFWHNGFGHPASHGCVNLSTKEKNTRWPNASEDAGWLYSWAALGVPVTVYREAPMEMAVK